MGNNGYTGQLIGPFLANQELINLIKEQSKSDNVYIKQLGIQINPMDNIVIKINNKEFEIGERGLYELGNTKITSVYFIQDVDENVIIDYTIKINEENV